MADVRLFMLVQQYVLAEHLLQYPSPVHVQNGAKTYIALGKQPRVTDDHRQSSAPMKTPQQLVTCTRYLHQLHGMAEPYAQTTGT